MTGKENREIKNSVFVDLFYEDESAEANEIALFNASPRRAPPGRNEDPEIPRRQYDLYEFSKRHFFRCRWESDRIRRASVVRSTKTCPLRSLLYHRTGI